MATQDTKSDLMTTREAADYLRLKQQTLHNWRCLGSGPNFVKLGSRVLYRRSDLDQYLDRQTRAGALPSRQSRRAR